jgi:signal transduction histidine kinase
MALVDPTKIEQMLNNLISNALKFSPPGGEVMVVLDRCLATCSALITIEDRGQVLNIFMCVVRFC